MMKLPIPGTQLSIAYNCPVTLTFAAVCLVALVLDKLTAGAANTMLFSCYRSSLMDPFTYIRFFGHAVGHSSWQHFSGNIMLFLVLGPTLEARYGSRAVLSVILVTAFMVGLVQFVFFAHTAVLGASGVVFAFILLASFGQVDDEHTIPLTLILVVLMYLGTEVWNMVAHKDNISQVAHIIGGLIGAWAGFSFGTMLLKG